ncbi:MAG TPA: hypothetical protein VMW58_10715 [Anaerolineae bacterium]|nr:hypothetical protein [Anaerolineae bacterium]
MTFAVGPQFAQRTTCPGRRALAEIGSALRMNLGNDRCSAAEMQPLGGDLFFVQALYWVNVALHGAFWSHYGRGCTREIESASADGRSRWAEHRRWRWWLAARWKGTIVLFGAQGRSLSRGIIDRNRAVR